MENKLDELVYIYSVDTSSFYNKEEIDVDNKLMAFKNYKSHLGEIIKPINKFMNDSNNILKEELSEESKEALSKIETKFINFYNRFRDFSHLIDEHILFDKIKNKYIINKDSILSVSESYLNSCIRILKEQLDILANNHQKVRVLRKESLRESNKISLFESTLTRSLELINNEISTDIIVVRAYRYVIFEKIIKEGFVYNGEKYEYFASSAGQIRNKKSCFVRSGLLNRDKHAIRNKLMCGLSINKINRLGGINQNKFQAYLSLTNSASKKWTEFDVDRAIVVDDMELTVNGLVDDINHETYEINRIKKDITINFIDGAGIMLPSVSDKSLQFRANWFKGLLVPFDFIGFIDEYCNGTCKVKDVYGKEWDIKEDNISIIFTKSQFKLWKYYSDWENFKINFKKYNCEASICKTEEVEFEDKSINYQMLQTLDFSEDELTELSVKSLEEIDLIGKDKDVMLKLLGASDSNENKNYMQKSLSIYPEMLNDEYTKQTIKNRKKSLVRDAKSGKIVIPNTKRTYISPDMFAFAQWLFLGEDNPEGLLRNGEVSCKLFTEQKLDLLRSPHLFREHCVRNNIVNEMTDKWFITNCVYTSVHDLISKQLMFDVDGDDSLIVSNPLFVAKAEKEMEGIVPLDYTLATAKKSRISNENIVTSLEAAYSKNIGEISNLITKIWNSKNVDLDLIKILCMENNAVIDYAKCLWMPTRPEEVKNKIKDYSKSKLPHFFKYAKNKEDEQINEIDNKANGHKSTMDRLVEVIPNDRINFTKVVGKFDYKNLMRNKRVKTDSKLANNLIERYEELDKTKYEKVKSQLKNQDFTTVNTKLSVYGEIRKELKEACSDTYQIVDILVRYLYFEKKSAFKDTLWRAFGRELYENIELNILGIKVCQKCKEQIDTVNSKKYCERCAKEKEKKRKRESWRDRNNKN